VLEHVTNELGIQYIRSIKKIIEEDNTLANLMWNKYIENDILGNPIKYDYSNQLKDIQNIGTYIISPSTLRYICFGLQIYKYIKQIGKNDISIIEVGGGYGGQCKVLTDICAQFNITIKKYTLIDLEGMSKLQQKYLDKLNIKNIVTLSNKDYFNKLDDTYDLFISNYALGEFTTNVQNSYINNVLNRCGNYFITWNSPPINSNIKFANSKEEIPQTGHARFPNVILTN
jgi:putative sugar O-methyltransferase